MTPGQVLVLGTFRVNGPNTTLQLKDAFQDAAAQRWRGILHDDIWREYHDMLRHERLMSYDYIVTANACLNVEDRFLPRWLSRVHASDYAWTTYQDVIYAFRSDIFTRIGPEPYGRFGRIDGL